MGSFSFFFERRFMREFINNKKLDLLFLLAKFARFLIKGDRLYSFFYRRMTSRINRFVIDKKSELPLGDDIQFIIKRSNLSIYVMNTTRVITEYLLRNPRRGL